MPNALIPEAAKEYSKGEGVFEALRPLIKATDGLSLSQVCAITGLEASTIQNWVKRGFVARPVNKKYRERQLARIMLISSLRECMKLESIGELMAMVNGDADDESDDIISEEKLYDCFSILASDEEITDISVKKRIKELISDYIPPGEEAYLRLEEALRIMLLAYASAQYKRRAEKAFNELKIRTVDKNGIM